MEFLYNIGITLFSFVLKVVSPFNVRAKLLLDGRNTTKKLLNSGTLPKGAIWVHCASLGEFEQGRPIIESIRAIYPSEKIVVSFFSPSGYEIRKNYSGADAIIYLPADTKANAKLLISSLQPKLAIFVKYEFWHHYIEQLSLASTPLYLVSAIFRAKQIFFKSYGAWFRKILARVSFFYCQDEYSVKLLNSININNCSVTGDTRFDRVFEIAQSVKPIPNIEKFIVNKKVLIAGSSWLPDEELFVKYIQSNPQLKLIIAPHETNTDHIEKIKVLLKDNFVLYSEQNVAEWHNAQTLVIDSIGLLSSLYQYGTIAYIGGGFGKGIHNTLEAATFGLPILFGPKYHKFKEARDLIAFKAAYSISNYSELEHRLNDWFSNTDTATLASTASKGYVNSQIGATAKIINDILSPSNNM